MSRLILVLSFLLPLFTGCAASRTWDSGDTQREIAFQVVNLADALQTSQIRKRADLVEGEPVARAFMGREPSARDTAVYFGSLAVSHFVIARLLPDSWRPWFQGGTLVYSGTIVVRNCAEHDLC